MLEKRDFIIGETIIATVFAYAPGTRRLVDVTNVEVEAFRRGSTGLALPSPSTYTHLSTGTYQLFIVTDALIAGTYEIVSRIVGVSAVAKVRDRFVLEAA
jgi:hypothetical protein